MPDGYRILSLDEIEPAFVERQQARLLSVRRLVGFRAAGINGWTGEVGERLVPPHAEDDEEELYVVVRGRARFTVGEETADAPAGTLVHVPAAVHREAASAEDGTIVVAIGGTPGEPFQVFAWEDFQVADALRRQGRLEEGRAVLAAALEELPDFWGLRYNAACWEAVSGNRDGAFELLRGAKQLDEAEVRRFAEHDDDLDSLRGDPRWRGLFS